MRLTIGPPGTGKTTHLAGKVREAVEKYGSHAVLIASLTKAAAAEVAHRELPIPKDHVGTLHAFAYRALGSPEIAETSKRLVDFSTEHPAYALGRIKTDLDEVPADLPEKETKGQELFRLYNLYRCRMVPRESWRESVKSFATAWEDWKRQADVLDFEDLIQTAATDTDGAPGNPWIFYGDEAQDWSKSDWRLVIRWAERCHALVVVGDWDQSIYEWRGADPNGLNLLEVAPEYRRVLAQSYRVPQAVHGASTRWISRIRDRFPVQYLPRDEEGECQQLGAVYYKYPEALLNHAKRHLESGKRVMVLAACSYMLDPLKRILRDGGIPFHNPYRTKRGDWNPLRGAGKLLDYLRPDPGTYNSEARPWTWHELWSWLQVLDSEKCLLHGAKSGVQEMANEEKTAGLQVTEEDLANVFSEHNGFTLDWLEANALKSKLKKLEYPLAVCRHFGGRKLREKPSLIIGTIHSVKGGEADVVYLFPDLSFQAMNQWIRPGSREHDMIVRQFYVGMTRAREQLFLCGRSGQFAVEW